MKISFHSLKLALIGLVGTIFYTTMDKSDLRLFWILLILNSVVIISSFVTEIKTENIFSFINIANIFMLGVFVLRPIQIIFNASDVSKIYAIGAYSNLYGKQTLSNLPLAEANFVGLLGLVSFNFTYYLRLDYFKQSELCDIHKEINAEEHYLCIQQILAICIALVPAIASMFSYIVKSMVLNQDLHYIDVVWVFIFSAIIIYIIVIKKEANIFVYIMIVISLLVLSLAARRQYIVNLLLCYIVPLYYLGKNRRDNIKKILIMCIVLLGTVVVYGSIRDSVIGGLSGGVTEDLMDEFCMYDMLVVSIKYVKNAGLGLFYGYNYLTIFTTPIPGLSIDQFDHYLTDLVFKGLYNGGIPVSLFGSLYLNFSYLGLIVGAGLLGVILKKVGDFLSCNLTSEKVIYYTIFLTFVYDLVRVGDIGREFWTMMITIAVCFVFNKISPVAEIYSSEDSNEQK